MFKDIYVLSSFLQKIYALHSSKTFTFIIIISKSHLRGAGEQMEPGEEAVHHVRVGQ